MSTSDISLDPMAWDVFRQQAHRMLDDMLSHLENIREKPVWQETPNDVRELFTSVIPKQPSDLSAVHDEFMKFVLPFTAANTHPGFFGWAQGGGTPTSLVADMLISGLNANVGGRDQIPLDIERQLTGWMRELFGFPTDSSGIFLTGTSMANFLAIVIARDARLGPDIRQRGVLACTEKLTAYASSAVHGSIQRALDMTGLGSDTLRLISVDSLGHIDLDALDRQIREDRKNGCLPFLVVGNAGTVGTGAIDDLLGISALCAREKLWFHVDGAFGALAMLSPTLAPLLRGIEQADSLAFDFHKWAQVSYDAGFLLVRDGEAHRKAFQSGSPYLAREPRGISSGGTWPCDLGPELSRSFRALKVWTCLRVHGTAAIASVIENTCGLAAYLKGRIEAALELELMAPVQLNVVCFRYRGIDLSSVMTDQCLNDLNRELILRLQEGGQVVPSALELGSNVVIRTAIVNHRTTRKEVDTLIEATVALGKELRAIAMPAKPSPALRLSPSPEQQLDKIDALLKGTPTKPSECKLRVERAMQLTRLGRDLEARSEHFKVLELEPTNLINLLELGCLLVRTGQKKAARIVYEEAVKHYPEDLVGQVNFASVLLSTDDLERARCHYEIALRLAPDFPQAHGGMFYTLARLGETEKAAYHQQKAFGRMNLFRSLYRGKEPSTPILLLVSSTGGNTPIEKLLDDTLFETYTVVADFFDATAPLPDHRLVVNGIGDADVASRALLAAERLIEKTSAAVLNRPRAVLSTGRCENSKRLAGINGLRTAQTKAYSFAELSVYDGAAVLRRERFDFPLLLREPGFHMGQHFVMVDQPTNLAAQLTVLPGHRRPGSEVLAIEYLDARGEDGCSRKYRVMVVDGELYPLHLAISSEWKIHYFSADMTDQPDHRAEESRFLADMTGFLGDQVIATLRQLGARLELDYGGIDFGVSRDGQVLLFEANATMVVEHPDPDSRWDYRRSAVDAIHAAVRRMLKRTASSSRSMSR